MRNAGPSNRDDTNTGDGRERQFSHRWGIPWDSDVTYVEVLTFILEHYAELGVTNTEMMLTIHLASFKYESEQGESRPALSTTIRERMGYDSEEGVRKVLRSLKRKRWLKVIDRPGKPNIYDFEPLARACHRLSLEKHSTGVDAHSPTGVEASPPQTLRPTPTNVKRYPPRKVGTKKRIAFRIE